MINYDKATITKILEINNFDCNNINIDKIKHVPMHDFKISDDPQPLLLIENLQVCVGIYAYGNGFGFAAHINTTIMRNDDFELDSNKKPIRCRRFDDLFSSIIYSSKKFNEPLNIGISIGCSPLSKDHPVMLMIYNGIDELIKRLNHLDITCNRLEDINEFCFIVDPIGEKIITPKTNIVVKK